MVANKWAYYNEFDPKAAAWLRELIKQGHIAPGEVDERDLWDVAPDDIRDFRQVHLCGGIGVWSYALRRAGWGDDRPCWTGSFPCQPFSAAGKGAGFADERHLWPAGFHLIEQCRPAVVFGEQVASKDAEPWLDLVQADLEGVGYALGAIAFPSAGVGAPHIRDRTYWVADTNGWQCGGLAELRGFKRNRPNTRWTEGSGESWTRRDIDGLADSESHGRREERALIGRLDAGDRTEGLGSGLGAGSGDSRLADNNNTRLEGRRESGRERSAERLVGSNGMAGGVALSDGRDASSERQQRGGEQRQQPQDGGAGFMGNAAGGRQREFGHAPLPREGRYLDGSSYALGGLADAEGTGRRTDDRAVRGRAGEGVRDEEGQDVGRPQQPDGWPLNSSAVRDPGPTNGLWRDADWLFCRDGKWRPVEPGTFPLAHGAPARVGCVCATCLEASAEGANDEDLRALRKISGQADGRVSPTVLQPRLPVGSSGEDAEDQGRRALAGSAYVPEHDLRDLRGDGREPSSPQGSRPQEQRPGEHPDTLSEVSQRGPSCERCGSERDLYEVTIAGNSRVARLRGYGNAINAEAAVAWIESYLEAIGERPYAGSGEAEEAAAVRA